MNDGFQSEKDEAQYPQNARLDPLGRSLRSTFQPPDGEELQPRIASLMIELSQQHYDGATSIRPAPPSPRRSLLRRLTRLLHLR